MIREGAGGSWAWPHRDEQALGWPSLPGLCQRFALVYRFTQVGIRDFRTLPKVRSEEFCCIFLDFLYCDVTPHGECPVTHSPQGAKPSLESGAYTLRKADVLTSELSTVHTLLSYAAAY